MSMETIPEHDSSHEYASSPEEFFIYRSETDDKPLGESLFGDAILAIWEKISTDPLASLFFALYVIVAVATFRHSAIGFASLEQGSILWGIVAALAIDVGMIVSASHLRQRFSIFPVIGLIVAASASVYTQILYAVMYAEHVEAAAGAAWMGDSATWVIEKRVIILPVLLPLLAVVYAFAAKRGVRPQVDDPPDMEISSAVPLLPAKGTKLESLRAEWEFHGLNASPKLIAGECGTHVSYARKVRTMMLSEQVE